jgi:hypothetical protein
MYRPETQWERDEETHRARLARLDQINRDMQALNQKQADTLEGLERLKASPALDPKTWTTSVEQVRLMVHDATHRTWMHAAYADVARRLEALDAQVTAMQATLKDIVALLHVLPFRASPLGDEADDTTEERSDA